MTTDSIEALLHRVYVENKPSLDMPFEVLLHRRLIWLAPHVYDDRASYDLPDVMLTPAGFAALDLPDLAPELLGELRDTADMERLHYEAEDHGIDPFVPIWYLTPTTDPDEWQSLPQPQLDEPAKQLLRNLAKYRTRCC